MLGHQARVTLSLIGAALLLCISQSASAYENSVVVESKTVRVGDTAVRVGVYISNAVPIIALALPLEFRSIDPGAYIQTNNISLHYRTDGRLWTSPLGGANPAGPPASTLQNRYLIPGGIPCSGPVSNTYQATLPVIDMISPDAILLAVHSTGDQAFGDDIDLDPGDEIPGVHVPSYEFRFSVSNVLGQFEIDTCCTRPASHLSFYPGSMQPTVIVPTFTKGVITIGCFCRCHGDPECDGHYDILDVVRTINSAFRNVPAPQDQDCTHARTDVDASGVTDIVDVTKMIDVVLNDGSVDGNIADPCAGP